MKFKNITFALVLTASWSLGFLASRYEWSRFDRLQPSEGPLAGCKLQASPPTKYGFTIRVSKPGFYSVVFSDKIDYTEEPWECLFSTVEPETKKQLREIFKDELAEVERMKAEAKKIDQLLHWKNKAD